MKVPSLSLSLTLVFEDRALKESHLRTQWNRHPLCCCCRYSTTTTTTSKGRLPCGHQAKANRRRLATQLTDDSPSIRSQQLIAFALTSVEVSAYSIRMQSHCIRVDRNASRRQHEATGRLELDRASD